MRIDTYIELWNVLGVVGLLLRASAKTDLAPILARLDGVIEGQRLSVLLAIAPASLKVDPAKFEPNKERLKSLLLEKLATVQHPDPSTRAWCVLNHAGFEEFVDYDTSKGVKNALARLIVNGEMGEAQHFLREVVDKL